MNAGCARVLVRYAEIIKKVFLWILFIILGFRCIEYARFYAVCLRVCLWWVASALFDFIVSAFGRQLDSANTCDMHLVYTSSFLI